MYNVIHGLAVEGHIGDKQVKNLKKKYNNILSLCLLETIKIPLCPWLLWHLQLRLEKKQLTMLGSAVLLSMWALVPWGIALIPFVHHRLFTRSWEPVNPHCNLWNHGGSSMPPNGESFFLQSLRQYLQEISTSLYSWFYWETYEVWLHQPRDGTPCLRSQTSAVKRTLHESNTLGIEFMLTTNTFLLMMQHSANTGRKSETV